MKKDKINGGKADKMSIKDIADKHEVSIESIKKQIEIGKKIEMEHVNDETLAKEISMDHLEEIPDYYTRLNKMEKEAKKELSLEAKKFMALAGIKEGDKKFLTNESFSESKEEAPSKHEEPKEDEEDLIIHEFEQKEVEPGEDDHKVYKIKMPKKKKG